MWAVFISHYFLFVCVSLPSYVRRGKPDLGFELFESECLSWPGFVELDDVNHLVLTFCSKKQCVFSLFSLLSEHNPPFAL